MKLLVNLCRIVLALALIFSGFVKAVDPLGTMYKMQDYLSALSLGNVFPDWLILVVAVALAAFEFTIGMLLLFAMQRRLASRLAVVFMVIMTIVTLWLVIDNPISDCGCFGDAVHLTNEQSLLKNAILTVCALVVALWPKHMTRFISESNQWIVENYTIIFIVGVSIYGLYHLPLFDFRPYHVGANIRKGMEIPEDAEQPVIESTFIMEKDGQQQAFTLENYPDSTWTFVERKDKVISQGYVPPIHDFSIKTDEGEDITAEVLADKGLTFLLISPQLEKADDEDFGDIDRLYEHCLDDGHRFLCLTSSGDEAREHWRDITGAEYEIASSDEITLKTIIRSNPGLVLLHDGQIVGKWNHNDLPKLTQKDEARLINDNPLKAHKMSEAKTMAALLLWFVLPIFVLTLADRLWAWTKYIRRKKKENPISQT